MQLSKPFDGNFPITQGFGDTITNKNGHNGIDYALPLGTPVLAAADSEVWRADLDNTGYGNCVMLKHEWNAGTVYAHLRNWTVQPGQSVKAGDVIGYSGSTGNSTGPHLHFEYRLNYNDWKSATDPAAFMKSSPSTMQNPESIGEVTFGRVQVVADNVAIRSAPGLSATVLRRANKGDVLLSTDTVKSVNGIKWRLCFDPCYVAESDGIDNLIEDIE